MYRMKAFLAVLALLLFVAPVGVTCDMNGSGTACRTGWEPCVSNPSTCCPMP
jgi:hypothetical protein